MVEQVVITQPSFALILNPECHCIIWAGSPLVLIVLDPQIWQTLHRKLVIVETTNLYKLAQVHTHKFILLAVHFCDWLNLTFKGLTELQVGLEIKNGL